MKLLGTVKWFSKEKGFGFIRHEEQDYFVHASDVVKNIPPVTLQTGDKVLFYGIKNNRGHAAQQVSPLEQTPC